VGAFDRELTDRTAAPHLHRVAKFDLAGISGHVAVRKDAREEEDLLVGERVGHLQRADIGKGHACVFGLATWIAAVHVRVAE